MLITEKFFNVRTSLFPTRIDTLPVYFYSATFQNNKKKKNNQSVRISIEAQSNLPQVCPVLAMNHYLKICRPTQGPLFQFRSGSPVTHKLVSTNLANILEFIGLNSKHYKHHSFRFGGTTHLANLGFSETYIRKIGRWKSNAMRRYIRIQAFNV